MDQEMTLEEDGPGCEWRGAGVVTRRRKWGAMTFPQQSRVPSEEREKSGVRRWGGGGSRSRRGKVACPGRGASPAPGAAPRTSVPPPARSGRRPGPASPGKPPPPPLTSPPLVPPAHLPLIKLQVNPGAPGVTPSLRPSPLPSSPLCPAELSRPPDPSPGRPQAPDPGERSGRLAAFAHTAGLRRSGGERWGREARCRTRPAWLHPKRWGGVGGTGTPPSLPPSSEDSGPASHPMLGSRRARQGAPARRGRGLSLGVAERAAGREGRAGRRAGGGGPGGGWRPAGIS